MDYKQLFRKIGITLEEIQHSKDLATDLQATVRHLVDDFRDDLGFEGARIYVRRGNHYILIYQYPGDGSLEGFRIPIDYEPIRELRESGIVLRDIEDPGVDVEIEGALGVSRSASIGVGDNCRHIIAFTLRDFSDRDHVRYTLNTIRRVIHLKFREDYLKGRVAQAREIQQSLLPHNNPTFGEFDIFSRTVPAEEVGGDLYDFIRISDRVLGIAVADSAGHGLPAALQARDAIIGLRMGMEERLRITATVEKLNKVISHSALSSKFISLFYGELEQNGTLVYCNAGHPSPLLLRAGQFVELPVRGMVLGPNRDAKYERGYTRVEPGSILLTYTDGITEASNERGEPFDVDRLKEIMLSTDWPSARKLVDTVFSAVKEFSGEDYPVDDQTVVVVMRHSRQPGPHE